MKNPSGYTFLGWSTQKGLTKQPKYLAGQMIPVKKNINLYPVFFNRKTETDLNQWELPQLDLRKYSKIIFVGDSRTYKMRATLYRECDEEFTDRIDFVCRCGEGLEWYKNEGCHLLNQKIANEGSPSRRKPIAVVFNLGVNDLRISGKNSPDCNALAKIYSTYFNRISKSLTSKNCKLFYMSVNPVNSCMLSHYKRREEDLRSFNTALCHGLNSRFTFLDTYAYLSKYGYSTNNDIYGDMNDDGLHYSMKTYKRIYKLCMNQIARIK